MKRLLTSILLLVTLLACDPTPVPEPPPPSDTTAPAAPLGFKATADNGKVKLEWTANTESDLEKYTLSWGSNATQQNAKETIAKTATQFEKTGLANGTKYYFKLAASDATGNTSSTTNLLSATPTAPDTTAPTLISSVPSLNASVVPLNTQVQLTFSKAMNISTVTTSSSNLTLGAATWNAGNTAVSFVTPSLQNDTTYTILIAGKDVAGNDLGGATTLQFSSVSAPPTVLSTSPTNNAVDIALNSKITLRFSRSMNKTSVETAFSSVPSIACTWTWLDNDQTATCTPGTEFPFATQYDFTLASSAQSAAGVAMVNPLTSRFTTVQDTTKPALTSYTPASPATYATRFDASIVLNFSKPMNQQSVQNAFQSQPNIVCVWTWTTPSSASCQPVTRLDARTTYIITLAINATDLIGNSLQAAYGFTFSVGAAPPKVIAFTPLPRFAFSTFAIGTPISITFSLEMNKPLTEAALQVRVGGAIKTGTITWNSGCAFQPPTTWVNCTQMTFTPTTAYGYSQTVTWKLSTTATENGNVLSIENEVTGSFQTEANIGVGP
jgi:Bacterial Ig-like domain/Fibronectin type III domain